MPNTLPSVAVNCFNTAGPVQIWVNTGTSGAFQYLGDTRNGARISEQASMVNLKSDVSGGEQGPTSDFQLLGEQHTVDLELARYSEAVLGTLEDRVNGARSKGMIIGCAGANFVLVLISSNFARKYTRAFVVEPIERAPIGAAVMFPRIVFTCLEDVNNTKASNFSPYDFCPWNTNITVSSSSLS